MNVEELLALITELAETEPQLLEALLTAKPEALIAIEQMKGVVLTPAEVAQIGALLEQVVRQDHGLDGELDEQMLAVVAGGLDGGSGEAVALSPEVLAQMSNALRGVNSTLGQFAAKMAQNRKSIIGNMR